MGARWITQTAKVTYSSCQTQNIIYWIIIWYHNLSYKMYSFTTKCSLICKQIRLHKCIGKYKQEEFPVDKNTNVCLFVSEIWLQSPLGVEKFCRIIVGKFQGSHTGNSHFPVWQKWKQMQLDYQTVNVITVVFILMT